MLLQALFFFGQLKLGRKGGWGVLGEKSQSFRPPLSLQLGTGGVALGKWEIRTCFWRGLKSCWAKRWLLIWLYSSPGIKPTHSPHRRRIACGPPRRSSAASCAGRSFEPGASGKTGWGNWWKINEENSSCFDLVISYMVRLIKSSNLYLFPIKDGDFPCNWLPDGTDIIGSNSSLTTIAKIVF